MEIRIDVTCTANPAWEKNVLKTMPTLSPQLTMQKQLNALIRHILRVLFISIAKAVIAPKAVEETISNLEAYTVSYLHGA